MATSWEWWVGFSVFVAAMLALDLGVFHRKSHKVSFKEAMSWVVVWIALALIFNLGIYLGWFAEVPLEDRGRVALEFFTAFLIEKALSMDNIFVFAVIFKYFAVPAQYQHKVLFYGIIGALVFRLVFILVGIWLIETFDWMLYVFGVILIVTGVRLVLKKDAPADLENNLVIRWARRLFPITQGYRDAHFFVRENGVLLATPMFLALLLMETTDLIFAADSIPAVLGVTQNRFIVYTSNVFAILGLRALYFVLASVIDQFHYLAFGLSAVLILIGVKMVIQKALAFHIPIGWSLGLVALILAASVIASLAFPRKMPAA